LQRARLLAALSVGSDIHLLHDLTARLGIATELNDALEPLAAANSTAAIARLDRLDSCLAWESVTGPETDDTLRVRGRIAAISEALAEHGSYFDSMAPA
jgi:hypothetical protein